MNYLIIDKNNPCTSRKIYWKNENIDIDKARYEIVNYKNYNISFDNKEDFYKRENPKISLIITIYNQENFIKYIYACIQRQSLKDIEIIFVDDASIDNSSMIINELMKEDKRIIYVKNEINRRAFYSRNKGVKMSKGEYVLVIDPDDLLLNDILIKAYETAKYYDLDILQYYVMSGSYNKSGIWKHAKYKDGILCYNKVKDIFYYGVTRNLWDKLIKRDIFNKSIAFMKEEFHNETYVLHNDDTAFLGLIKVTNKYGFLEQIGYFYNLKNPKSTQHFYFEHKYMNNIFHSLFATMKYYYIQSDDNALEKKYVAYKFFNDKVYKDYKRFIFYLTTGFDYIIDVLNLYLNCKYYNQDEKSKLQVFKSYIEKRKSEKISYK